MNTVAQVSVFENNIFLAFVPFINAIDNKEVNSFTVEVKNINTFIFSGFRDLINLDL
jgi:hypothetical protein